MAPRRGGRGFRAGVSVLRLRGAGEWGKVEKIRQAEGWLSGLRHPTRNRTSMKNASWVQIPLPPPVSPILVFCGSCRPPGPGDGVFSSAAGLRRDADGGMAGMRPGRSRALPWGGKQSLENRILAGKTAGGERGGRGRGLGRAPGRGEEREIQKQGLGRSPKPLRCKVEVGGKGQAETGWPWRRARSASTIILTRDAKSTWGFQPSLVRALVESPRRSSTSAGRMKAGSMTTWSR